jgi:glycosyltransferase involved in cell wall biosynthesis
LKAQGRFDEAMDALRKSYSLRPDGGVLSDIRQLRPKVGKTTVRTVDGEAIIFSVQDLFGYLNAHSTMSGIQRVQAGISLCAIENPDVDAHFILNDLSGALDDGEFWLIDRDDLKAVINYASGDRVDHDRLRIMLTDCENNASRMRPAAGTTIILLGAFWGLGNNVERYIASKREGVRIGAYVYDIIPVTHPEYCDELLVRDFTMSLCEMCSIADFVLTISDYSQFSLRKLLREHGGRNLPIVTVPLAHSLTGPPDTVRSWPAALQRLKGQRYVAYVSTVEGRKNHIYVVNAWKQMIEDGIDVPDLVFVGRKGWRISGLMDLLDGTSNLGGRVHIVHDLTDAELNAVYAECMFTIFTSYVEGWGLPVGESLLHGRPCIASKTSSIPEVGGDFVDYVDPQNLREGIEVIARMILDDPYREGRRQNIIDNFAPRTWDDVSTDFIREVKNFAVLESPDNVPFPMLTEGKIVRFGDVAIDKIDLNNYVPCPQRLITYESFHPPELIGAWLRGSSGHISFATGCAEGEDIIIYLSLFAGSWANQCSVTIAFALPNGRRPRNSRPLSLRTVGEQGFVRAKGQVGKNGVCTLFFEVAGDIPSVGDDPRVLAMGLRSIAFVRSGNVELRTNLIEEFTFMDI